MGEVIMKIYSSWLGKALKSEYLNNIRRKYVAYLLLPVMLFLSIFGQSSCLAAESSSDTILLQKGYAGVYKYRFNGNFSIRGWKLSPNVYLGQTKAFGNRRYGLLIDKGDYAYGLINQQVSILKSF